MTNGVVLFPDAQLAVRDLVRSLLAGRTEPFVRGVTVSTRLANTKSDDNPSLPYVAVRTDATYRDGVLNGRSTVRLVVWHRDEGLAVELARLIDGLLLASSSDRIRSITSVLGPNPTTDVDTGDPLCYFTVTARLRPANL